MARRCFAPAPATAPAPPPPPEAAREGGGTVAGAESSASALASASAPAVVAMALPWVPGVPCQWPLLVCIDPSKPKLRSLKMRWSLPPVMTRAEGTPSRLLGHIIGHEGEGSLHAALKSGGMNSIIYIYI